MNESNTSAQRLIEVFNQAELLPTEEQRREFLAEACGDDATLRAKVEELLGAHGEVGSFLKPMEAVSPELEAEFARLKPEEVGERIGHYKLLEQIGQGGFGTVWVAEQERPVRRRVALKIIKLGMDTKEVIARFGQERQALAMMDHPNIAKVFDAGASKTGRPYFVMELVRGIKITDYCDQANLSTAERLELFIAVCQAVQHAHQKGIIHRDLKPSNILVTLHDGVPVPKVIDFGVAKATQQQRLTDLTVYTQFEQMTEAEALYRDELARRKERYGDRHRKVSDALVWLAKSLQKESNLTEAEAAFREVLAAERNLSPEGDPLIANAALDLAVVLRDSGRHAEAEPFIREGLKIRRKALGDEHAETLFAMSLFAGTLQTLGKHTEALALYRERLASRKAAYGEESTKAAESLADLASALHNAGEIAEADMTFQEALSLCRKLPDSMELTAEVLAKWGAFLTAQGRLPEAEETYREELRARKERYGDNHREVSKALGALARLQQKQRKISEAEAAFREVLALERNLSPEGDPLIANAALDLGVVLRDTGRHADAEPFLREGLEIRRKTLGAEHAHTRVTISLLASTLQALNKHAEAVALNRERLASRKEVHGAESANVAESLSELAWALYKAGEIAEADTTFREALSLCRKLPESTALTAEMLAKWGSFFMSQQRFSEAVTAHREEVELRRKVHGDIHRHVEEALCRLARSLEAQGRLDEAETAWREELAVEKKLSGDEHPFIANSLIELARFVTRAGRAAEAEPIILEALTIRRKSLGDEHFDSTDAMVILGCNLRDQGKQADAEDWFRKAVALDRQASREGEPSFANHLSWLGVCLFDPAKYAEAEGAFREALGIYRKARTQQPGPRSSAFDQLARALTAQNKSAELNTLIQDELGYARAPEANGATAASPQLGLVLHHGALALHAAKLFKEARPLAEEAWMLYVQHPDWPENERQHALQVLLAVLTDVGDQSAIESLQRKGIDHLRAALPADDPVLAGALAELTLNLLAQKKFSDAEPPARESLALREKGAPDDWRTFNSRSMLGASLLGQKKYSEAEPLLLSGYDGMKQREKSIPALAKVRLREVLQRLGELSEATGDTEKAAEWKKKLSEFDGAGATAAGAEAIK